MIKINIPQQSLRHHQENYSKNVEKCLEMLMNSSTLGVNEKKYFKLLYDFHIHHDLLIARPCDLYDLINSEQKVIDDLFASDRPAQITNYLDKIFSYNAFTQNKKVVCVKNRITHTSSSYSWGAWRFLKDLNISVCPYCNADTIFSAIIVRNGEKKHIRSALDHFFPQSLYPFLSISLYNLIPACTRCNTNIKRSSELCYTEHIHPYDESFHDGIKFECIYESPNAFYGDKQGLKLKLQQLNHEISQKAANSGIFFSLEDVYNSLFIEEAAKIVYKKNACKNPAAIDNLKKILQISDNELECFLWGMKLDPKEINSTRLSKLLIDIVQRN